MRNGRVCRTICRKPATRGRSSHASAAAILSGFFLPTFFVATLQAATNASGIRDVSISGPFFNPTLGQKVQVSFSVGRPGSLSLFILDRDGFLVRKLVSEKPVQKGKLLFEWDGRDQSGEVVPDEAYSLKITLAARGRVESYFPANMPSGKLEVVARSYDSQAGILSYTLASPARVHVQAGTARTDSKSGQVRGVVLRTLVNREPRPAGSVIESWNGLDESATIRVPDLSDFVLAIAATTLPENSIICTGSRKKHFLETIAWRRGRSLLTFSVSDHGHHQGLTSLDDVAPRMRLTVENGSWSAADRRWTARSRDLKVAVGLEGPSALHFVRHPGRLMVFLDREQVSEVPARRPPVVLSIPAGGSPKDTVTVTVNWVSDYGPVAVNSVQVSLEGTSSDTASSRVERSTP